MGLPVGPVAQGGRYGPGGAVVGVPGGRGEIGEPPLQGPPQMLCLPLLRPVEAPSLLDKPPQHLAPCDVLLDPAAAARLGARQYALHGAGHRADPT